MADDRNRIKKIAIDMVKKDGLINLSRRGVCEAANIADGSFPHNMGCTFLAFVDELQAMKIKSPHTKVIKSRVHPALRKEHILNTAVALAETVGYDHITRDAVAEKAGISGGLVSQYFTMVELKNSVMRQAVDFEVLEVIAQGLVGKHPLMKYVSEVLKRKAINHLKK